MDAAPPNPSPVVQASQQLAIDLLKRVDATQRDVDTLFAAMPTLATASSSDAQALQSELAHVWAEPDGHPSRRQHLGGLLVAVMRDFAALGAQDGTLGEAAARVARRAADAAGATGSPSVHLHELILGHKPYAGAVVVTDDDEPGVAMLFTPHAGWSSHDSMEHLLSAVEQRWIQQEDAGASRGIASDDMADAQAEGVVGVRAIGAGAADVLAMAMVAAQARQVAIAVDDFALSQGVEDAPVELADRIRRALHPTFLLDIDSIAQQRSAALIELTLMERLAGVPVAAREAWLDARDVYNDTLEASARVRLAAGLASPRSLEDYAAVELGTRLRAIGIDDDPRTIVVDITDLPLPHQPLAVIEHALGNASPRRVSLIQLACENLSASLPRTLHAMRADGTSIASTLGSAALTAMVRELDLGRRYRDHLAATLRDGTGALARSLGIALDTAWLRMEAQEARLSYYLPGGAPALIDDHAERGYRWLEAALDAPVAASRQKIDGHEITVSQLTYKGTPLADVLVVGARSADSVPRIVMYTPGAPDGRAVREFEDRQAAGKAFLYHPAFREYLLDRLPTDVSRPSANGGTREFKGDHRSHWVLGVPHDAAYTLTEEPFEEKPVTGNFHEARYDAMVALAMRNASLAARSAADADSDATQAWVSSLSAMPSAGQLVATALAEVPSSLVRAVQASWRMYDQIKAGDMGEAFVSFTEAYVNAINIVMPPFAGGRQIAQGIVRAGAGSPRLVATTARAAAIPARFESRYAARGVTSPGGAGADGIHHLPTGNFIRNDGRFYAVHYHADYGTWRLARQGGGHPHPDFTGPAIRYIDGQWQFNQEVGLPGGMRRFRERFRRLMRPRGEPVPVPAVEAPVQAAVPEAPAAAPRWAIALPDSIEHLRAEITGALTDNPSAWLTYRADGSDMQFNVPSRSGFIVDPNLHPELAGLSSHQRRMFLDDLETRFPQRAERNEVLTARGWARDEGYRIPSPPGSPGARPGSSGAVQSTEISSSSGSGSPPTARPALTARQNAAWDEALASARRAPRLDPADVDAVPRDLTVALAPNEPVPYEEWPDRLWVFSARHHPLATQWNGNRAVVLMGYPSGDIATPRLRTVPVSALPPELPRGRLADALGVSRVPPVGERDPLGRWLEIDFRGLVESGDAGRALGFGLRRRPLPSGDYQYSFETMTTVRLPEEYIRRGRRDGAGTGVIHPARRPPL